MDKILAKKEMPTMSIENSSSALKNMLHRTSSLKNVVPFEGNVTKCRLDEFMRPIKENKKILV